MKSIRFLIAHNLSLRLILSTLRYSANKSLLFGILIDFVSHLSNDIVYLVAEFDNQFVTLEPEIFPGPYQLNIRLS